MKIFIIIMAGFILVCSMIMTGCDISKETNNKAMTGVTNIEKLDSRKVINIAKSMETDDIRTQYLIKQAQAFYNAKKFQYSIDIAQYILRNLDANMKEVKDLLEKAKMALTDSRKSGLK